jgi:hypothetical protein
VIEALSAPTLAAASGVLGAILGLATFALVARQRLVDRATIEVERELQEALIEAKLDENDPARMSEALRRQQYVLDQVRSAVDRRRAVDRLLLGYGVLIVLLGATTVLFVVVRNQSVHPSSVAWFGIGALASVLSSAAFFGLAVAQRVSVRASQPSPRLPATPASPSLTLELEAVQAFEKNGYRVRRAPRGRGFDYVCERNGEIILLEAKAGRFDQAAVQALAEARERESTEGSRRDAHAVLVATPEALATIPSSVFRTAEGLGVALYELTPEGVLQSPQQQDSADA